MSNPDFSEVPSKEKQLGIITSEISEMNDRIKNRYKTFQGTFSKNAKPQWIDPAGLIEAMRFDGQGAIHIEQYGNRKSNRQNDYFQGVLMPHVLKALRNAGYTWACTNDDARAFVKERYFKLESVFAGDLEIPRHQSTKNSEWPKDTWEMKMMAIRADIRNIFSYDIPPPNEPDLNEEK